jgi:hypothetical protein
MTYEKNARAGEPCLALRKKTNLTGFTLAGAAALFVALAGNAPAIPITLHDDVNALISSHGLRNGQSAYEAALALDHGTRNQSQATPITFNLPAPARVQNTGTPQTSNPRVSRPRKGGRNVGKKTTQSDGQDPSPQSVPDSGSTAMMLGGVFCGFALVERKLKA